MILVANTYKEFSLMSDMYEGFGKIYLLLHSANAIWLNFDQESNPSSTMPENSILKISDSKVYIYLISASLAPGTPYLKPSNF